MSALEVFSLVKDKMNVVIQLRLEKHGTNKASAYDARLSGDFSNSILLKLHPDLRDTFYKAAEQADVEGFKKELKFPRIENSMKWDLEIPRTLLRFHDIHDPKEDLVLADGKTDSFEFDMLEGGTVKLSCRVKLAEMSEEQITKLLRANGQEIPISLECAAPEEKQDNFQQVDLISQEPMSEAREKAESMFSQPSPEDIVMGTETDGDIVDATFEEEEPTPAPKKRGSKRTAASGVGPE